MIKQEKTSKIKSKNIHFGVVIGVVGELNSPYSPVNKGKRGYRLKSYTVPDVIGMPYQQALELLESNGLLVLRVFEKSDVAEGAVLRAAPQAGTSVAEGTAITLYVSSGE
jgi:hypothetical protein